MEPTAVPTTTVQPTTLTLLDEARAHLTLGSIAKSRDAYRRAGATAELQLLDTLVANWFDHPTRLAFLFPMPMRCTQCPCKRRELDGGARVDGS